MSATYHGAPKLLRIAKVRSSTLSTGTTTRELDGYHVLSATIHARTMRPTFLALTICAAVALTTPDASAVTCYLLFDRNDNVVYQDIYPPYDLSDAGANERNASRARNEHMIAMETDKCARLELVAGPGVGLRINLDEMGDALSTLSKPATAAPTAPPAKRSGTPTAAPKSTPSKAADKPATK